MSTWWSVEERGWKQELPHLSDDVIALLAAPVVVSASSFGTAHDVDVRSEVESGVTEPGGADLVDASIARMLTPLPARGERRARTRV